MAYGGRAIERCLYGVLKRTNQYRQNGFNYVCRELVKAQLTTEAKGTLNE